MNTEDVVRAVIVALNEQNVPYMIVSSLATNFYCVPRSTQDADIVVQRNVASVAYQTVSRLPILSFDRQLQFEGVSATKKALLRADENDFDIELFELSDDEHDQERFSRRVKVEILGSTAWIATAEDMLITKLRWSQQAGREKDISDARNLIAVQAELLNWAYVEAWCDRHGTRALLDRLREECAAP